MKLMWIALIVLSAIVAVGGAYYLGVRSVHVDNTHTTDTYTYHVTTPEKVTIIREQIPAIIDTVYIDNTAYEVATYHETTETDKVYTDLSIKYHEGLNLFDVRNTVIANRDSVYVERIEEKIVKEHISPFKVATALSVGFRDTTLDNAEISSGIVLKMRYTASLFVDTDKRYGLRLGVIW